MANDDLKAARAANRDVPKAAPGPFQDCSTVVHIAVFFDGTGNNRKEDTPGRKWSNVARMFDAAHYEPNAGVFAIYVSGVGTPFNGVATGMNTVWLEDGYPGMGVGAGGDRRMDMGADNVNQRLRDVMIANAQRAGGKLKAYADQSRDKSFTEVNGALARHRLIKVINLSVFGFSRGAALARAFSNRVIAQCKAEGGQLHYEGHPMRVSFMGLFDTVASFGVPAQNARLPWEERDLILHDKVERCVHYVAAHEVRAAFPVDLIRKDGKLDPRHEETVHAGVHSDVGGGYGPNDQGVGNDYARIPMISMMFEAVWAGVRMDSYDQMRVVNFPLFNERFHCQRETQLLNEAYLRALGSATGPVETQVQRHMKLLYSAYGSLHRAGKETPGDRQRQENRWKLIGPKGMAWEVNKYRTAVKLGRRVRISDANNLYAQYVKPEKWQLDAWDTPAPNGVAEFVDKFVHDSKVDFLANVGDPFSYFSARGIQESTRSIWQPGTDWIDDKAHRAAVAVKSGYITVKAKTTEAYGAAKTKAGEAYDTTVSAAHRGYDATKNAANRAYDATVDGAKQAYDKTSEAASKTYEAGMGAAHRTTDAAQRQFDETSKDAKRVVESGVQWVEHTASDLMAGASPWKAFCGSRHRP